MARRRRGRGPLQSAIEVGAGSALLVGLATVYLFELPINRGVRVAIGTGIATGFLWMIRSLFGWLRRLRRPHARWWKKTEGGLLLSLCAGLAAGTTLYTVSGAARDRSIEAGTLTALLLFSLWLVSPLLQTIGKLLSRTARWVTTRLASVRVGGQLRGWRRHRGTPIGRTHDPEQFLTMTPQEFEELCCLLVKQAWGYQARVCGESGDGGIDVEMWRDGEYAVGQCKRYSGTVPISHVRDFYGAMMHVSAVRGYFFTTGRFSDGAYEFVEGKPIALIDGEYLANLVRGME